MVVDQLRAEIAQVGGEAIAGAVQSGEVESPIEMIGLNGIGKAFDIQHRLVELGPVGKMS